MSKRWLLILSLCFVSACQQSNFSNSSSGSSGFQKPSDACAAKVVKNQYLVHWKDDSLTLHQAPNDDEFVKHVVAPNQKNIVVAEPNYKVSIPEKISSRAMMLVIAADNWGQARVHADQLWQRNIYGNGVTVAVIDTGIDRTHPQLKNQLALNSGEIGTDSQGHEKSSNGVDDDGNGFVDDWNGFNFITYTGNASDDNGHGTHVSGIIAAEHHDNVARAQNYVQGMAPQAKILPLKFLNAQGDGDVAAAIPAINYAVARGARVINASWGGDQCSASLKDKIASLAQKNVLFVAASGNEGIDIDQTQRFPASFSFVSQITVGATGLYDAMTDFSNYGDSSVHLFAPGAVIISTYKGGGLAALDGTSMATPFVSGAAALLFSYRPSATLDDLRKAIFSSVSVDSTYHNETHGRLDLTQSIQKLP